MLQVLDDYFWPVFLLAIPLYYFFGGPLITLSAFWHKAQPMSEKIDEKDDIPLEVRAHFVWATDELSQLGFDEVESLLLSEQMANTKIYLRLFVNRTERDAAIVASFFAMSLGQWKLNIQNVEFCTRYRDGVTVNTNNNDVVGAFPAFPGVTTTNAPWLTQPDKLYRAHRAICRWVASGKTKTLRLDDIFHGDAAEYIGAIIVAELDEAKKAGYLRLVTAEAKHPLQDEHNPYQSPTAVEERYVATIKGAYLMTWRALWPIKPLWTRHRIRQGKRRLAEAGFFVDDGRT